MRAGTAPLSWRRGGFSRDRLPDALKPVVTVPKYGFETAIQLQRSYARFEVEALGASGRLLGRSEPFGLPRWTAEAPRLGVPPGPIAG